jgi:glucan 1,3-beta-glucosidase
MRLIFHLLALAPLLLKASAFMEHIPYLDSVVYNELVEFGNLNPHVKGGNVTARDLEERQGTAYWLENIAHQGKSAFGPAGYKVFRNVKDYGAKGTSQNLPLNLCKTK